MLAGLVIFLAAAYGALFIASAVFARRGDEGARGLGLLVGGLGVAGLLLFAVGTCALLAFAEIGCTENCTPGSPPSALLAAGVLAAAFAPPVAGIVAEAMLWRRCDRAAIAACGLAVAVVTAAGVLLLVGGAS